MSLSLLLLGTGCHLFQAGFIEETCTELGNCVEGEVETAVLSGLAWVAYSEESSLARALVVDRNGLLLFEETIEVESDVGLDLAWLPVPENLAISTETSLVHYSAEIGLLGFIDLDEPVTDLRVHENELFVAGSDRLDLLEVTHLRTIVTPELLQEEVVGLVPGGDHELLLVSFGETGNLWSVDFEKPSQVEVGILEADYDSYSARSRSALLGPGAKAHVCAATGAMYAVSVLADGSFSPALTPQDEFEDVVGCAFDGEADELILFSRGSGLVWVDSSGATVDSRDLDEGSVLVGAYSW